MSKRTFFTAIVVGMIASVAQAEMIIQLDVNNVVVRALDASGGPTSFGGASHTGSLLLDIGATRALIDFAIDDVPQPAQGTVTNLVGEIDLLNGAVMGGQVSLLVQNPDLTLHGYSFSLVDVLGTDIYAGPSGFSLIENTTGATFSDANFAAVDVSPWYAAQPLSGAMLLSAYEPDLNGLCPNSNLELAINVPEPGVFCFLTLLAMGTMRNRKLQFSWKRTVV